MTDRVLEIRPSQGAAVPAQPPPPATTPIEVAFDRDLGTDEANQPIPPVRDIARGLLNSALVGEITLTDPVPGSRAEVRFLSATGALTEREGVTVPQAANASFQVDLTAAQVAAILAQDPEPAAQPEFVQRQARFAPIDAAPVDFAHSALSVAAVTVAAPAWTTLGLDKLLGLAAPATASRPFTGALPEPLAAVVWTPTHLAVDGGFTARFGKSNQDAWLWWLTGSANALGVVVDDLQKDIEGATSIPLPPLPVTAPAPSGPGTRIVPADPDEREIVENPAIYTEDPGAFCTPFNNPERVLGERAFSVIYRAEQPIVSPEASDRTVTGPFLDFELPAEIRDAILTEGDPGRPSVVRRIASALRLAPAAPEMSTERATARTPLLTAIVTRDVLPPMLTAELQRIDRGRRVMDAQHPVQWDSDASRYQAVTVARGHILEFRLRWRSNGYSLGTVAKTLTLAARQVKRIQKIEWRRLERSRREERTQLVDRVSDVVSRDRQYEDGVEASLSEWARGESESSSSAAAGGFGFATAGFVIGGGGGGSNASSSSSTQGGRRTTASEEQRLRDTIRRYGESLRRLDSVVVNEVTQQEEVTGTTEIVRNPNYGHALTVIYYQILRHLKVETAFAGVRECLFVPFAIKPFTLARAFRWRDLIRRGLLDRRFETPMRYLKDVLSGFAGSDVPPGRRSQQPVRHVSGSLYFNLAVARPRDTDDGGFNAPIWGLVNPFVSVPVTGIFAQLRELAEARRDRFFQEEHAPGIAAGWVNTLRMSAGSQQLSADLTLATRYQYNGTVRVDFSAPVGAFLTREMLASIRVRATRDLPPGSVANLTRATITYQTDHFQRTFSGLSGTGDLVSPETGVRDPGALIVSLPDPWERQDVRAEMIRAVNDLIGHLNEHVEHYHKVIWWNMDLDRVFMLVDGFEVPGYPGRSIGSVIERDPIAIVGNAIVFRVSAGSFLGLGTLDEPAKLYNYYATHQPVADPMLISLPTDGLYAQTIMDPCDGLEEHYGSTDWILLDKEPELGDLDPTLLTSRRAEPTPATPTPFPTSIINLQNAPEAPDPSGLAGVLNAVTNPNAFRDMAGLAGTQANAAAALQTAAQLATNFGNQAAALKLAQMAKSAQSTASADQRLATVQRAVSKGLATPESGLRHGDQILEELHEATPTPPHENSQISDAIEAVRGLPGSTIEATTPDGAVKVEFASSAEVAEPEVEEFEILSDDDAGLESATAGADEKWIILVAGYNYAAHSRGTTTYGAYARNRAALLLVNNPAWGADTKVRFLLINVGEGRAYVDDRTKGSLASQSSWKPISELRFAGTSEDVSLRFRAISSSDYSGARFVYPIEQNNGLITPPGWEDRPVFSMVHWYNLLRTFGRAAPGTVLEASILSHGNPWGPILVNTFRDPAFHSPADPFNLARASRERDPADVDGRADADFVDPNLPAADALDVQKAFAPGGFVWLWGCAAFPSFKRLVQRLYGQPGFNADGSTPDATQFQFTFDTTVASMQILRTALANNAFLPTSGLTVQRSLGDFKTFLDVFLGATFADRLADTFKVKCFATALGTGSEPDRTARLVVHHVTSTYEPVVAFYERYMSFTRDPVGRRYVDYKR